MQTLSQQLIDLLQTYGVDTVFGIPGVHTVEMYRGLQSSRIRHVSSRHEQSLGFMADGYARVCGKPGVCFVITGPGVTNILTAMGQAYADSIPMLVISGVNPQGRMGSGNGYLHELPNQQALTERVSAFSHTITRADELPQVLARAFAVFDSARPRPVHIEIPLNLMNAPVPVRPAKVPVRLQSGAAHAEAVQLAAAALLAAHRPLICVGGGALAAAAELQALAERLDAPVVMTINARGMLPPDHALGISASPSFPAVRALVAQSDVLLAIGTHSSSSPVEGSRGRLSGMSCVKSVSGSPTSRRHHNGLLRSNTTGVHGRRSSWSSSRSAWESSVGPARPVSRMEITP